MTGMSLFDEPQPIFVPSFDAWYERYPRKQGKADARKRWGKMSAPERASAWQALDGLDCLRIRVRHHVRSVCVDVAESVALGG